MVDEGKKGFRAHFAQKFSFSLMWEGKGRRGKVAGGEEREGRTYRQGTSVARAALGTSNSAMLVGRDWEPLVFFLSEDDAGS